MTNYDAFGNWDDMPKQLYSRPPSRPRRRLVSAAGWVWIGLALGTVAIAVIAAAGTNIADWMQL